MVCCPQEIIPFGNEVETVIDWNDDRKSKFGTDPSYEIMYYDEESDTFYTLSNAPAASVRFDGMNLMFFHGGLSTGYIRLG